MTVKCLVRRPLRRCLGSRQDREGAVSSCSYGVTDVSAIKDRSSLAAAVSGKSSSFSHEDSDTEGLAAEK